MAGLADQTAGGQGRNRADHLSHSKLTLGWNMARYLLVQNRQHPVHFAAIFRSSAGKIRGVPWR